MAKIADLAAYIERTGSIHRKAMGLAMLEVGQEAHRQAVINAKKNFKGRYGYTLSGRLMNSIFTDYDPKRLEAYVGTRGIAYGRIHEEGGRIEAGKHRAQYLWQRLTGKGDALRRMTPFDFYKAAKKSGRFIYVKAADQSNGKRRVAGIIETGAAGGAMFKPLFLLRKWVDIKARPYLRPAAVSAGKIFPDKMNKRLDELLEAGY